MSGNVLFLCTQKFILKRHDACNVRKLTLGPQTRPNVTPEGCVERHSVKRWATEQAAVFDELGVRTCWIYKLLCICNVKNID